MADEKWYYVADGRTVGPVDADVIRALIDERTIGASDLLWRPGMSKWERVGEVAGFGKPPPLDHELGHVLRVPVRQAARPTRDSTGPDARPTPRAGARSLPVDAGETDRGGAPGASTSISETDGHEASGTRSTTDEKRGGWVLRHWRGDLSLPQSYWVNTVLLGGALAALLALALEAQRDGVGDLRPWIVANLGIILCAAIVNVWQYVGVWRSADKHASRGGSGKWAGVAQLLVAMGAFASLGQLGARLPAVLEDVRIVLGRDDVGAYKVTVADDTLWIEGDINFGVSRAVEAELRKQRITTVVLSSRGGRVAEGFGLQQLFVSHGIQTTIASTACASACVIPFMAARERLADVDAMIGFHQSSFPGMTDDELRTGDEKIRHYLVGRGVSVAFLAQAYGATPDEMFVADHLELVQAGVLTGVRDAGRILRVRDLAEGKFKSLAAAEPISAAFEIIQESFPAEFARLRDEIVDQILSKQEDDVLAASIGRGLMRIAVAKLEMASDEAIVGFYAALLEGMKELQAHDPILCYAATGLAGPSERDVPSAVAQSVGGRILDQVVPILRSAAEYPHEPVDALSGLMLFARILMTMKGSYGDKIGLLGREPRSDGEKAMMCSLLVDLYSEILRQPPADAATALRYLVSEDSGDRIKALPNQEPVRPAPTKPPQQLFVPLPPTPRPDREET